jgi:hypothetical protein
MGATRAAVLPRHALGLGLRPVHFAALHDGDAQGRIDFLEIVAENFLGRNQPPRDHLDRLAHHFPIVAHNVSLNLLGITPLDDDYLGRLRGLVQRHGVPCVTDHLCWSASAHGWHHDLLPVAFTDALVEHAVARIQTVQRAVGVPVGVENVSTYLRTSHDTLAESTFVRRVLDGADCGLLLDLNNIVVSAHNHDFDPSAYLDDVPWDRVLYVHVAGHARRPDGLRHDTHDRAVDDEVWALYAEAWRRGGPFPTVLEWDDDIPALPVVLDELERARRVRRGIAPTPAASSSASSRPSPPSLPSSTNGPIEAVVPARWSAFVDAFGALLHAPLVVCDGRFASPPGAATGALRAQVVDDGPGAAARLALYHEQAWKRFFTTAQQQLPRVVRVVGPFPFNRIVGAARSNCGSTSANLDDAFDPLAGILETALRGLPATPAAAGADGADDVPGPGHSTGDTTGTRMGTRRDTSMGTSMDTSMGGNAETAVVAIATILRATGMPPALIGQALRLDIAERRAFRAPFVPPERPDVPEPRTSGEPGSAPRADELAIADNDPRRLLFAPSFALFRLRWDLADGRATTPPTILPVARHVVVARTPMGVAIVDVHPAFARLLARATTATLGAAITHVLGAVPAAGRDGVRAKLPHWLADAVARGWCRIPPAP